MKRIFILILLTCSTFSYSKTPMQKEKKLLEVFELLEQQEKAAFRNLAITAGVLGAGTIVLGALADGATEQQRAGKWFLYGTGAGFLASTWFLISFPTHQDKLKNMFQGVENLSTRVALGEELFRAQSEQFRRARFYSGTLFAGMGAGLLVGSTMLAPEDSKSGYLVSGVILAGSALMFLLKSPLESKFAEYEAWVKDSSAEKTTSLDLEIGAGSVALSLRF